MNENNDNNDDNDKIIKHFETKRKWQRKKKRRGMNTNIDIYKKKRIKNEEKKNQIALENGTLIHYFHSKEDENVYNQMKRYSYYF